MASDRVPMGRMFIDDEMLDTAQRILASGQWIKGPESKAFGKEWAEYCGALGGVPCSNGSVALIAALHALEIGPGHEAYYHCSVPCDGVCTSSNPYKSS